MNGDEKQGITQRRFHGVDQLPTPPDLWEAPELLSLAALDVSLDLADVSLLAAYPQLCDLEAAYEGDLLPLDLHVVRILFHRTEQLRDAIAVYRRVLRSRRKPLLAANEEEDIPF
jgi:hypothetical protein